MAKEFLLRSTCDRCKKVMFEKPDDGQVNEPDPDPPALYLEFSIEDVRKKVVFADLCPNCKTRVHGLVDQLERRGADAKEAKKVAKKKQEK